MSSCLWEKAFSFFTEYFAEVDTISSIFFSSKEKEKLFLKLIKSQCLMAEARRNVLATCYLQDFISLNFYFLFFYLFIFSLSHSDSLSPSFCVSLFLSFYPNLSIHLFIFIFSFSFSYLSIYPNISFICLLYIHISYLTFNLSIQIYTYLSIYVSL